MNALPSMSNFPSPSMSGAMDAAGWPEDLERTAAGTAGAEDPGDTLGCPTDDEQGLNRGPMRAEPARSLLGRAKLGLVIDHRASVFASGWLNDAFTEVQADGTLRSLKVDEQRKDLRRFKNMDRFLAAWNKIPSPWHHAEAAFWTPVYSGVVVKTTISARGLRRAERLAAKLGLPLRRIRA